MKIENALHPIFHLKVFCFEAYENISRVKLKNNHLSGMCVFRDALRFQLNPHPAV